MKRSLALAALALVLASAGTAPADEVTKAAEAKTYAVGITGVG